MQGASFVGRAMPIAAPRTLSRSAAGEILFVDAWWLLFCFCFICEGIQLVVNLRLIPITAGVGLMMTAASASKDDLICVILMLSLNVAAMLSAMLGNFDGMLFYSARICIISPYVCMYLMQRGLNRFALAALASATLPNLFAYLTGITFSEHTAYTAGNQFRGIAGDPNYICMYLVTAFGAQLALVRIAQNRSTLIFWSAAAATTLYLIVASLSRAGALGVFLVMLMFGLSFRVRLPLMRVVGVLAIAVVSLYFAEDMLERWLPDSRINLLYRRFMVEGDASLVANSRFTTWKSGMNESLDQGPLGHMSEEEFKQIEGMVSHNAVVHCCLMHGWLTGLIHVGIWTVGLGILAIAYCRDVLSRKRRAEKALPSQAAIASMILTPLLLVMLSLSVATTSIYWFSLSAAFTMSLCYVGDAMTRQRKAWMSAR